MSNRESISYMEDSEIISFVRDYLEMSSYSYAVLIDGGWGCGKTYFIKNTLIPALKDDQITKVKENKDYKVRKVVYISLYGITSTDELARRIFIESLPLNKLIKSNGFHAFTSISKVILEGALSYSGISVSGKLIDITKFTSLDNSILIFDDLERCNMNINETMGYINNFVEHDNSKVIIVANEKEIASTHLTANQELKYMVAAKENITFPSEEEEEGLGSVITNVRPPKSKDKLDIKGLSKRVNNLFGEDILYKQIKEKLVGKTIYYKPDLAEIIKVVVKNYKMNDRIKETILKNKDSILEKYNQYKYQNIRTLMFCFDKYKTMADDLISIVGFDEMENVLRDIIRYTVEVSIRYKTGQDLYIWEEKNEIQYVSFDKDKFGIAKIILGFKFIDDYVTGKRYVSDRAVEVIRKWIDDKKVQEQDPKDPLYMLSNGWWLMEDKEAAELLEKINQALVKDPKKYDVTCYSRILALNIRLKRIGILSSDFQEIIETMQKNINLFNIDNKFDTFGWARDEFDEQEDRQVFTEAIKELNASVHKQVQQVNANSMSAILDDLGTWDEKMEKYVNELGKGQLIQNTFLSRFDFDKLLIAIKQSSSIQINKARYIISQEIYGFSNIKDYYSADKDTVELLIDELSIYYQEIKDEQKIKANNIYWLIKDLERIAALLC